MFAGSVPWSPSILEAGVDCSFDFAGCLRWPLLVLIACGVSGVPKTASAHKMFVFATVQGDRIEGEVYYQGGDPAPDAKIVVSGPDGTMLDQAVADQQGRFRLEPRWKLDYRIVADDGFGHRAEYTIPEDELPSGLPAFGAESSVDTPANESSATPAADSSTALHEPPSDLVSEIAALSQQISALRRDLERSQARLRTQDVLGGIGYILGLMGLGSYLLRNKRPTTGPRNVAGS